MKKFIIINIDKDNKIDVTAVQMTKEEYHDTIFSIAQGLIEQARTKEND